MGGLTPSTISARLGGLITGNIGGLIVQVVIWSIIISVIGLVFFVGYLIIQYKHKLIIFKTQGDGRGGITLNKFKIKLAKKTKDNSWKILGQRKTIEPFPDEQRYGNWCFGYEIDDEITPGIVKVGEQNVLIEPVPYAIRKKTELELQQLEQDFAKMDAWESNKIFIYTLIGIGMVVVLAGFVLWLAFKKTDAIVPALENFGNFAKNVNTIPGKG